MDSNEFYSLPVYKHQVEIARALDKHNRLIVIGETGSGKTTQVPKILYQALGSNLSHCICITQPRRVAAISVALRVNSEIDPKMKIGGLVGYSVRFDERTSSQTKIKYVTDGMLLREAILDNNLSHYSVIIIDEIHERSINTDTLLALILRLQQQRKELKLVVMSATINLQQLRDYLKTDNIIQIKGRSFPIEVYHSIEPQKNIVDSACITILQIHLVETDEAYMNGDILVFLPGQEDIEDLASLLAAKNELLKAESKRILAVLQLFSNLPNSEQMKVFQPIDSRTARKVILSTNIAETSVTIKNIKYVVDCGMFKTRVYDCIKDLDSLLISRIYKHSATQRTGRAGRESAGKCFRLYTEQEYQDMRECPVPEILRSNLKNLIILLKSIGLENLDDLNYLDKPDKDILLMSMNELRQLKAVDSEGNLTTLGRKISILPVEPSLAKMLISSFMIDEFRIIQNDILILVSILQVDNIFYTPSVSREKAESIRSRFTHNSSDHLTMLNVYHQWQEVKSDKFMKSDKWAAENFINEKSLQKAEEIKKQLQRYLLDMIRMIDNQNVNDGVNMIIENEIDRALLDSKSIMLEDKNKLREFKESLVLKCMLTGYTLNIAKFDSDNIFVTGKGKHKCRIHPNSTLSKNLKLAKKNEYIIYSEIIFTNKQYIKTCSVVSKEMIDSVQKYC